MTLPEIVERRVRQMTHGRIRDLKVVSVQDCIEVRGNVPSHHTKQLALQGMMEVLPGGAFRALITVRSREPRPVSTGLQTKLT